MNILDDMADAVIGLSDRTIDAARFYGGAHYACDGQHMASAMGITAHCVADAEATAAGKRLAMLEYVLDLLRRDGR